ncbi:transaldolase family protein [Aeoliella sp.]|uniref:transaldolase family protein n=1 Tax=Aeoliella sp. TaxID=2795800 RepID=UPI003CCB9CF6
MQLWLASSDLKQVEKMMGYGVFAGVITNPKVVADARMNPKELFAELCKIAPAAWYQLQDADLEDMKKEADEMLSIDPEKIRIKSPATLAGFGVISHLSKQGLDVMATCVPTSAWLCFALAAGATRIAPYGSMLQKRGIAAKTTEVLQMQKIIDAQAPHVTICTGIYDVTELPIYAAAGVKSFFLWGKDVDNLLTQPLVNEAASGFHEDWREMRSNY